MEQANNPFTHVFAKGAPVCDRGGEAHDKGPFFELGCGHSLCQNCVLVSAKECALCRWQPHPCISDMFSKYCPFVTPSSEAVVQAPVTDGARFNAFGFYLGASLAVEMCFLFLNRVFTEATAEQSIKSVFRSIGDTVPDQFVESIVHDVHWRSLSIADTCIYRTTAEAPLGNLAVRVANVRLQGSDCAMVLCKHVVHLSLFLEGKSKSHVFDPFGVGRCRLPCVSTFQSDAALLAYLATRLRNGASPDLTQCPLEADLQVSVIVQQAPTVFEHSNSNTATAIATATATTVNTKRDAAMNRNVLSPVSMQRDHSAQERELPQELLPPPRSFASYEPEPSIHSIHSSLTANPGRGESVATAASGTSRASSLQEAALGLPEAPWLSGVRTSGIMDEHFHGTQHIAAAEARERRQLQDWARVAIGTVRCSLHLRQSPAPTLRLGYTGVVSPASTYRPLRQTQPHPFLSVLRRTERQERERPLSREQRDVPPQPQQQQQQQPPEVEVSLLAGALDFSNISSLASCPPSPSPAGLSELPQHRSVSQAITAVSGAEADDVASVLVETFASHSSAVSNYESARSGSWVERERERERGRQSVLRAESERSVVQGARSGVSVGSGVASVGVPSGSGAASTVRSGGGGGSIAGDTASISGRAADLLLRDQAHERASFSKCEEGAWRALRDWESIKHSFIVSRSRKM